MTRPVAASSTTTARRSRSSSAWTRPSRNDCSSRAAWYSAFSLRSPCSRAVLMRATTSRRLTRVSSSSSAVMRSRAGCDSWIGSGAPVARRARRPAVARPGCRDAGSAAAARGAGAPRRAAARAASCRCSRSSARAPSASPGAHLDDAPRRLGRARLLREHGAGDPVRLALAGRAAQVRPRQRERRGRSPRRRDSALPEGIEERVEVLLGRVGLRPPDPDAEAFQPAEQVQPLALGMGLAIARHVGEERRDPAADRAVRRRPRRGRSRRATRRTRAAPDSAFEVGRSPSIRSPGRRSSHFPTRVSSSGAVASGAPSSTT